MYFVKCFPQGFILAPGFCQLCSNTCQLLLQLWMYLGSFSLLLSQCRVLHVQIGESEGMKCELYSYLTYRYIRGSPNKELLLHIITFKAPYCWTSVEGRAHTCFIGCITYSCGYETHMSSTCDWSLALQCFKWSDATKTSNRLSETVTRNCWQLTLVCVSAVSTSIFPC